MGLCADTTFLSSSVGDIFIKRELGDGVISYSQEFLENFFDSTGYFSARFLHREDTLKVETGSRSILEAMYFISADTTDTLVIQQPYAASIIDTTLKQYLVHLSTVGHPFAKLSPQITRDSLSVTISVDVDKGPFVASTKVEVVCSTEVRPWLIERALLFSKDTLYNYEAIHLTEEKLRRLPYVKSATFGPPEVIGHKDTVSAVIPLYYEPRRQLYFDGAILYQSEGSYHVTGRVELKLNNMFGAGEQIGFSYRGEGYWQRAFLDFSLPYVGGSPLTIGASGRIEVHEDDGGYGEVTARVGLDVLRIWQAGFGATYHEVSQNTTRNRYGGITLDLMRKHAPLQESLFDWETTVYASTGFTGGEGHTLARAALDADFLGHIPFGRFAYVGELRGGVMAFSDRDSLYASEKFRLGGYQTVRGYGEELYPAIGYALNRSAFRFYLSQYGALYLFMDNAVKVENRYAWADAYWMMGYGFGISLPVRSVRVTLEWARHRLEKSGLGRIHFSLSN